MPSERTYSSSANQPQLNRDSRLSGDLSEAIASTKGLLDEVLRQTESTGESETAADHADLNAMRSVARRYSGRELCCDPILVELVDAMLNRQFAADLSSELRLRIANRIALTLFEDPESHARLTRLWSSLSQAGS